MSRGDARRLKTKSHKFNVNLVTVYNRFTLFHGMNRKWDRYSTNRKDIKKTNS